MALKQVLLALAAAALAACSRAPSQESVAGATAPANIVDCGVLSRKACMDSRACTLVHAPDPGNRATYLCRAELAPCESGVAQTDLAGDEAGARKLCEQRAGCTLAPSGCYCHCRGGGRTRVPDGADAEQCNCACGGGPPPNCVAM